MKSEDKKVELECCEECGETKKLVVHVDGATLCVECDYWRDK